MNDNSETKDKLIVIADPAHSWYQEGESLTADKTCLNGGETTGIAVQVQRITGDEAVLSVTYGRDGAASNQNSDSRQENSAMAGESSIPPRDSEDPQSQSRETESSEVQSEPPVDQVSTPEGATPASPAEETSHEPSPPQDVEGEGVGQGSTDGRDSTEPVWDKSENAEVEAGAAGAILITVVLVLLIWLIIRPKPKRKKRKGSKRHKR